MEHELHSNEYYATISFHTFIQQFVRLFFVSWSTVQKEEKLNEPSLMISDYVFKFRVYGFVRRKNIDSLKTFWCKSS